MKRPRRPESFRGRNYIQACYFGLAEELVVAEPLIDAPDFDPVASIVPLVDDPFALPLADPLSVPIGVSVDEFDGVNDLSVLLRPLKDASLALALLNLLEASLL
jgi:hypothetical protein